MTPDGELAAHKTTCTGNQVSLRPHSPEPHCVVPRSERHSYERYDEQKVKENANNLVQHTLDWQGPVLLYDPSSSLTSSLRPPP